MAHGARLKRHVPAALTLALTLVFCLSVRADSDRGKVRETGPEDGKLCCDTLTPFLFDGDEVLARTGRAGIFRFDRREERWRRSMEGLVATNRVSPFVNNLCQAPSRPRVVYAVAGSGTVVPFSGLFFSEDFGEHWTRRTEVPLGFGGVGAHCAVDADDARTVYISAFDASFFNHIWKSTDGGKTVQDIGLEFPQFVGSVLRTSRGTLYVGDDRGILASTDGGVNFHRLPTPSGLVGIFEVSSDGRAMFVNIVDAAFVPIGTFRSADGGASFTPVGGLPNRFKFLAFDPADDSTVYVSADILYVSTDGGLSFAPLPASDDPRFLGGRSPIGEIGVDARGSVYINTLAGSMPGRFVSTRGAASHATVISQLRKSSRTASHVRNPGRTLREHQSFQTLPHCNHCTSIAKSKFAARSQYVDVFGSKFRDREGN